MPFAKLTAANEIQPCIRRMHICVIDILDLYSAGMTSEEILADYPDLEQEDLMAVLIYADSELDHPVLAGQRYSWMLSSHDALVAAEVKTEPSPGLGTQHQLSSGR